jgi:hypothetical protein
MVRVPFTGGSTAVLVTPRLCAGSGAVAKRTLGDLKPCRRVRRALDRPAEGLCAVLGDQQKRTTDQFLLVPM